MIFSKTLCHLQPVLALSLLMKNQVCLKITYGQITKFSFLLFNFDFTTGNIELIHCLING